MRRGWSHQFTPCHSSLSIPFIDERFLCCPVIIEVGTLPYASIDGVLGHAFMRNNLQDICSTGKSIGQNHPTDSSIESGISLALSSASMLSGTILMLIIALDPSSNSGL
jgi:hypothetical protein